MKTINALVAEVKHILDGKDADRLTPRDYKEFLKEVISEVQGRLADLDKIKTPRGN